MDLVVPLRTLGARDTAVAGGKAANLGELIGAGFAVPAGFVLTTEAYAQVTAVLGGTVGHGAAGHAAVGHGTAGHAAALRARLATAEVPEAIARAILDAHADLGGGPVAVRSSATAEDLPGATFAGQQDTELNVVGSAALLDAVRRCWASLWTDRAIDYRDRYGIDHGAVRMAVVVQRMVDAETAGVMFTADPVTGDRQRIVVDASDGLGEAVVSGAVSPDHYLLDGDGRVVAFTAGRREVVIRSRAGGGVERRTARSAGAGRLSAGAGRLSAGTLADLASTGRAIADHFGRPQDIEWAVADGRLWLLQARPMTALPPPPVRLTALQRRIGAILLEYIPYRPYPIDMTTWLPYGPAGLMARVLRHFGLRDTLHDFLHETDGVVDRLVPPAPRLTLGVVRTPVRIAALARRYDPAVWTADPRFVDFDARMDALAAEDLTELPWDRLTRLPDRVYELLEQVVGLRIGYLPRTGLALLRLRLTLALLRRGRLAGDLVLGAPTRTEDANRGLMALAARVRADPALRAAIADPDPARLTGFGGFQAALAAFLAEYGHRESETPLLVTSPTWGEDPQTVLALVRVLAAGEEPGPAVDRCARASAELFEHPLLRGRAGRARMARWIAQARAGIAFREDSHFHFTRPLPVLRRSLLEMGSRLVEAGALDSAEEVFHLRFDELAGVADPARLPAAHVARLRATARARAARRTELAGVRLIDPAAVFGPRPDRAGGPGDALLTGTPASGGVATGPVRVVTGPAGFGALTEGDVLVCPYTNPSWTPLFRRAAAVVVDAGGVASHAAIVAREYGIPAVMGTGTGTRLLTDGQVVTVDGDAGRVTGGDS